MNNTNTSKYNKAVGVDPSKPTSGDTKPVKKDLAEGKALIRLVQYYELGVQKQPAYEGEPKKPAPMCKVAFEVVSKRHIEKFEKDGEEFEIARFVSLKDMMVSNSEMSNYVKYFNIMNYEGKHTKYYDMINELFYCTLVNKTSKSGKVYTNITNIQPPREDVLDDDGEPTGETKPVKTPAVYNTPKVFLFDQPFKEDWDALYFEKNNWLQETIIGAENYVGSPVEAMLAGLPGREDSKEDNDANNDLEGVV